LSDQHSQVKRIDEWIATLEQKARALLDGLEIDAEEMSPKERVDCAAKLMTLAQRYMVIRQQSEATEPTNRNAILLTLMKQMRGEITEPVSHTARLLDQPDGE
jgi:hypothetical protein